MALLWWLITPEMSFATMGISKMVCMVKSNSLLSFFKGFFESCLGLLDEHVCVSAFGARIRSRFRIATFARSFEGGGDGVKADVVGWGDLIWGNS